MGSYHFLLDMALILFSTKLFGIVTKRFALPQVVGALLAGLLLGPACLGVLVETDFMDQVSEIGVIVLMFTAGLETDVQELRKSGRSALIIALCGVAVPLAGGFLLGTAFGVGSPLESAFLGVILTATSVSITVETLREMGKLSTRSGSAVLSAALIDDILGIVALTLVTSMADPTVRLSLVLLRIGGFFAAALVLGVLLHKGVKWLTQAEDRGRRRYAVFSFGLCFFFAYGAETFFGVADITGAYLAGVIIANTSQAAHIASRCETLSFLFFSPVFFAGIGVKLVLPEMSGALLLFALVLTLVAMSTKLLGCGLGARLCGYSGRESLQVGVGMVCRGEVALIVATKGLALGLMQEALTGPVILCVMACAICTPVFLKLSYGGEKTYSDLVQSDLVDQYEAIHSLDIAAQLMLEDHQRLLQEGREKQTGPNRAG